MYRTLALPLLWASLALVGCGGGTGNADPLREQTSGDAPVQETESTETDDNSNDAEPPESEAPSEPDTPEQSDDPVAEDDTDDTPTDPTDVCTPTGDGTVVDMPSLSNTGAHHHHSSMEAEHAAFLALVDYDNMTHAAIADGYWCNPDVWHNQSVPGDGARVVIPSDRQVQYNQWDDSRLHTLRIDGELTFANDESSRMIVDTLVLDPRGTLNIGTVDSPISASAQVDIVIADNGDIDVDWDPLLLSRGLILHGTTNIHGAVKTPHLKVATDPVAGDTTLHLNSSTHNWQVGDTLVIPGSRFSGWKWDNDIGAVRYHGTQDEVRTITAVEGDQVTLDSPLIYDHLSPRADLKISVGNFSRNVAIRTENAEDLPNHRRGHVMFMHSQSVDVRYAEFFELGRTDKSQTNMEATDLDTAHADSNVRGRYSFHFHRTGTSDQLNPAMAIGNAVFGSPGWGYVHHDSHAMLHQNVSYNTFGAGFVAETGNETGAWTRNLAIKAEGISGSFNPKNNNDIYTFDIARSGDGFWFQGRMVASVENIAASVNRGFTYFHRDKSGTMIRVAPELFMFPEALGLSRDTHADNIPIRHFHGNEAFASTVGVFVVKAGPNQGHDVSTVMSDFTAWEVRTGAFIEYTAHYLLNNFDVIGNTPEPFRRPLAGISFGNNTTNMVVRDARIEDFSVGVSLGKEHTSASLEGADQFVIIGGEMIAVETPYEHSDDSDLFIATSELVESRFEIELRQTDSETEFEFEYLSSGGHDDLVLEGTRTDSIGESPLPAGSDRLRVRGRDMVALVSQNGYYLTESGEAYTIVKQYFSERATGDVHLRSLKTYLGPEVQDRLENQYHAWRDAKYLGLIDLDKAPPVAQDNSVTTPANTEVTIAVLDNDSDPEGSPLRISAVLAPPYGEVFHDGETIRYRPYFDFTGEDYFHYWVTDDQGNFSRARVDVTVY
ncbi:Ig-like domain-containing protein [Marinimicrobium sp. ABcell2]|uniref:Ig-like domain-containing protein n=1 Tax=Marinimicrobium sp. ABcell2 TaxID=3069751 RepID=UPI0027B72414|nr:G8 domain-containing protein [Marinimicrobium sp. ABcell2]MDQ2076689.1 G8 domain-containing protein [Marinimicrobium sp. ABcell2]